MSPNMFPITPHFSHILCPKILLLKTYIGSPKEEITIYLFWDCPKLEFFSFGDGPIKYAHKNCRKTFKL
jgi:hypothetical protein